MSQPEPHRSSIGPSRYRTAGFGYGLLRFLGLLVFPPAFYVAIRLADSTFVQTLGIVFSLALTGAVIEMLGDWRRRRHQRVRDERAIRVLADARRGDAGPYSLYLRGFDTTGRLQQQDQSVSGQVAGVELVPSIDLETALAQALEKRLPTVGLGRPGEAIGVGRVPSTDSDWQADVASLTQHASLILLMPFPTPGTLWEVEFVMPQETLERCVFVMPPLLRVLGEVRGIDWRAAWGAVREEASRRGLGLPHYHPEGALIAFGPSRGSMAMVMGVNSSSPSLVSAQLSRVQARAQDLRRRSAGAPVTADVAAHKRAMVRLRPAVVGGLLRYAVFYGALIGASLMVLLLTPLPLATLVMVFLWGSLWFVKRVHHQADRRELAARVGEEAAERAQRGEVWEGQSAEELKASRGLPDFVDLSATPKGMSEVWHYGLRPDGTTGTQVVIVDGSVRQSVDLD